MLRSVEQLDQLTGGLSSMALRYFLSTLTVSLLLSGFGFAQAPQQPTPVYTGNIGGGFALTGGNTDTRNFNLTAGMVRDPKTRNVIKGTAAYLRGDQNDVLNLDR